MRPSNQFKAGLFIVISFAIALGVFFGITGSALFNGPTKRYTVVFDLDEDVGGLAVGSEVRVGGLKVGTVKTIDVVDLGDGRQGIQATLSLPARYGIRRDATVAVQVGLTGTVNLNVTDMGKDQVATADDRLDGQPDALSSALASLGDVGGEVTQTLQAWRPRVSGILDDARPRVNATLDQVRTTAASADATLLHVKGKIDPAYDKYAGVADSASGAMANLRDILGDTKGDFRETMANITAMTGSAKDRLPIVLDKAGEAIDGFKDVMDKTSVVLADVKEVAANANDVTASIRGVINGNRARLDEIIKSANLASQNLAAASAEIRHAPWRLLYKPSESEVANQNLYDATRQFAEASRKLQDSAQALRDVMQNPKADAQAVQTLVEKLDADFRSYEKVEKTLWDSVRK